MTTPESILVIRLGAMGDVLHALPAVASLKLNFPVARLSWVVSPKWMPLLEGNPYIDDLLPHPGFSELRKLRPSCALDFQGLIKSALIGRLAFPGTLWGFDKTIAREPIASWFYTQRLRTTGAHRIERNLELAKAAGATVLTTESWIPPGVPEGALPGCPFVLAAPFAGWTSKQWPIDHYRTLRDLLAGENIPLVLNVAPAQAAALSDFIVHTSSLSGLIHATRSASAIVGVDSGPLHLAAALRKPGVAIFGPTDPAATGPYGGSMRVLRHANVITSYKRENKIHSAMRAVAPAEVFAQLLPQLTAHVA